MSLKRQAITGVFWTFAQQFSVQIINFGVQIILARMLLPEMFGLIAMLTVFIAIGQTLMDGGMTTSLIRTKNADQLDYATVFVSNLLISCIAYLLVFISAPIIADFYNQEILKNILRIYALTFVVRAFAAVHIAKLTKEMNFKFLMKLQIPSTIVGAIVGITLAYMGYGVWSLVLLTLTQAIVFTFQNWFFSKWRPSFIFNKKRFRYHFSFGYRMTIASLIDTIYNNSYFIVIGKFFTPTIVGFYSQAENMRLFPVGQISAVMGKVTYPLFSNINSDIQLKSAYKSTMKLVLFAAIPTMLILVVVAKELFLLLFGQKWLSSVPYFQILAIASIVRPFSTYNLNILKVKGRSDLLLKVEVFKKLIGIVTILFALPFGIMALVITITIMSYISTLINMWFSGKLIGYNIGEQIKSVSIILVIGVFVFLATFYIYEFLIDRIQNNFYIILLITVIYSLLYFSFVLLLDKNMVRILKKLIKY